MFPIEHLHPMLLHFPIVLAVVLLVVDAVALSRGIPLDGRATYASFSFWIAIAAGAFALVTMSAGDMALEVALSRGVPEAVLETHEGLGSTTALIMAAWAVIRFLLRWRDVPLEGGRKTGIVLVEAVIVVLILATAWFGGNLVYGHGVNVMPGA